MKTSSHFLSHSRSYCWIHGTAYVRDHLQGKATGCFVDQSKLSSEADAPVTAYYLWLPFLLIIVPVIRMIKMVNTDSDKNLKITLSVAVAISFVVFNLPLATVAAVR